MNFSKLALRVLLALAVLCAVSLAPHAMAQSATSGAVVGTVSDPSGAVVPKAEVSLLNTATNASQTVTTNDAGGFTFPNVAPAAQLQTTDSQIGNTVSVDAILRLPNLTRNATELMNLQPGTAANSSSAGTQGAIQMRVAGAIDDQNTVTIDGIDITQNIVASGVSVPTPDDSVEEFRGGVTNPNANFGRSSGANITLIGRHGSNVIHGALYEYLQNFNLNANTWDNNLVGLPKAIIHDNRFGARLGGPIKKNKTFLFGNWEERRFQSAAQVTRTVPTQTLRNGILQFRDATGAVEQFNLKTAAVCGAAGNQACDPRGLGVSPAVAAQWAKEPLPNTPGGDGLNTGSFFGVLPTPIRDDYGVARLDHNFSDKLQFNGSYTYYRHIATSSAQISILDGTLSSVRQPPNRASVTAASLNYQIKPNLLNTFRFGYVHDTDDTGAQPPSKSAGILNIPGTQTSAGPIALLIGGGVSSFLDSPIDMDTQRARHQADYAGYWQYIDDMNWVHGKHTVNYGVQFNKIPYTHVRADKVVGSLSSLAARVDGDASFLFLNSANEPLTCSPDPTKPGAITTNCITSANLKNWDRFFSSSLGLVDNVGILTARDANLKPLPFGTDLRNQTNQYAPYFYAQDSWRITPSLTLTYGLAYGWQTSPTEVSNLQTLQIDASSGAFITGPAYLASKQAAALQGQTFNPLLGYQPIGNAHRPVVDTDYGAVSPRVAVAWNPSKTSGFLRWLGDKKTVIRSGFAIVYDRTNTVQTVLIPMLGVGFGQTITVQAPLCNATGAGGAGCNAALTSNAAASSFRVGVDGTIPLPVVPAASIPVVPPVGQYSETLSFQDDPANKIGRSFNTDLSIQRELPGNMIIEAAFIGRQGRRLPQAVSLGNSPYMFVDSKSGQTFAQAFDAMAGALRANATPATQPWFENQFPGINPGGTATAYWAARKSLFTTGDVSSLFFLMDQQRLALKLPTFNNSQVQDLFMRTYVGESNYNAGVLSLQKRFSHGLQVAGNYTYAKALDEGLLNQNQAFFYSNSYHPGFDYSPSAYDLRHTFNAFYYYEVPAGQGHRLSGNKTMNLLLGGWYTSGIFTARSGFPLAVDSGTNSFGADINGFANDTYAIPTSSVNGSSANAYNPACKAEGRNSIGAGGSGLNIFADPCAAFNSFRLINISSDTRSGRANPFYGQNFWNIDMSAGKSTKINEKFALRFSADFFNIFNHHNLADPNIGTGLSLQNPNAFGVITRSFIPGGRSNSARWIQLGLRLEF